MYKVELRQVSKDWLRGTGDRKNEKPTSQWYGPMTKDEAVFKALELCQQVAEKEGCKAQMVNDYCAYCDTDTHTHTARLHLV